MWTVVYSPCLRSASLNEVPVNCNIGELFPSEMVMAIGCTVRPAVLIGAGSVMKVLLLADCMVPSVLVAVNPFDLC